MTILRTVLAVALLNVIALAQPAVTASDAWAAAAAGGTASVYLVINNPTMYDIYVVSATSDTAGKAELINGDKAVANLTVAAYGSLELKAGGMFVRLSDLKRDLKAGESLLLTLSTDGGIDMAVTAVIKN